MANGTLRRFSELNGFFLTRGGPAVGILFLVGAIIGQFVLGGSYITLIAIIASLALRSIVEWCLHKYLWHLKGFKLMGVFLYNPIYRMHLLHHRNPGDISGFLFGPAAVVVFSISLFGAGSLIFDLFAGFTMVMAGLIMLLFYEWFHLLAHSDIMPKSQWLRKIVVRHRFHHSTDAHKCYCVSQIWADCLMSTDLRID